MAFASEKNALLEKGDDKPVTLIEQNVPFYVVDLRTRYNEVYQYAELYLYMRSDQDYELCLPVVRDPNASATGRRFIVSVTNALVENTAPMGLALYTVKEDGWNALKADGSVNLDAFSDLSYGYE